jgi:hypothetical protein
MLRLFGGLVPVLGLCACADYTKNRDTITLAAGDAQSWNRVVHATDPWPPYAGNVNISGDGQRVNQVIRRYSTGRSSSGPAPSPGSAADSANSTKTSN